jgi:ABC-type nickel/cobalt efflux system permease component RcnA
MVLVSAAPAMAHPLGNFTVNTADRVVVVAGGVDVLHVVDLAEIPTVQARGAVATAGGLPAYARQECRRVQPLLALEMDGRPAELTLRSSKGSAAPGAGGLTTTRLVCTLASSSRPNASIHFTDGAVGDRVGWREVSLDTHCGSLRSADVPTTSTSKLLTSYPDDLLSSPLDVRSARAEVVRGACSGSDESSDVVARALPRGVGGITTFFTDFLGRDHLSIGFGLVSVLAALAFGIVHALAPGHGKTVMAAYLVGQRGTRRQALQLGGVVTFTHTASVLALGALLTLGTLTAPERVVPLTEVLSGLLLAALGCYLAVLAVRRLRSARPQPHDHPHEHEGHHHAHGGAEHASADEQVHTHGGRAHSHVPLPTGPLGWKALAGMGVAGGLVPSPSALVVLLGATALGRAWFGVVLVVVYGLGMAITLTAAGLLLLRTQAVLDRRGWTLPGAHNLARLLPLVTASVVVLVGLGLMLRGAATGRTLL